LPVTVLDRPNPMGAPASRARCCIRGSSRSSDKETIGRRLRVSGTEADIVGIIGDVRDDGLDAPPRLHMYGSMLQTRLMEVNATFELAVFLRTRSDIGTVRQALMHAVHEVDPELPVFGVRAMDELMAESMARQRFALFVMSIFVRG
jgi:hypothetical protein